MASPAPSTKKPKIEKMTLSFTSMDNTASSTIQPKTEKMISPFTFMDSLAPSTKQPKIEKMTSLSFTSTDNIVPSTVQPKTEKISLFTSMDNIAPSTEQPKTEKITSSFTFMDNPAPSPKQPKTETIISPPLAFMDNPAPSTKKPKTKYNTNCCVFGCTSRKGKDRDIHFHYFPNRNSGIRVKVVNEFGQVEEMDKRKAWEEVLSMTKPVTKHMRVCSKHFKDTDYHATGVKLKQPKLRLLSVPSKNLPKDLFDPKDKVQCSLNLSEEQVEERDKFSLTISDIPFWEVESENSRLNGEDVVLKYDELSHGEKLVIQTILDRDTNEFV